LSPIDDDNKCRGPGDVLLEQDITPDFVKNAKSLLVWVCREPCLFLSPPHCWHSVFTVEIACHTGIRMACLDWGKEMVEISRLLKEMEEAKDATKTFLTDIRHDMLIVREFFSDKKSIIREEDIVVLRSISDVMKWLTPLITKQQPTEQKPTKKRRKNN